MVFSFSFQSLVLSEKRARTEGRPYICAPNLRGSPATGLYGQLGHFRVRRPEVLFGFLPYPTSSVALAGRRTRIVMVLLIDDLAVFNAKCVEDIEYYNSNTCQVKKLGVKAIGLTEWDS